jgi:hypothetical protein
VDKRTLLAAIKVESKSSGHDHVLCGKQPEVPRQAGAYPGSTVGDQREKAQQRDGIFAVPIGLLQRHL